MLRFHVILNVSCQIFCRLQKNKVFIVKLDTSINNQIEDDKMDKVEVTPLELVSLVLFVVVLLAPCF